MPRTIGVVTVARSDYGHLTPLLRELHAASDVDLCLFVGGAHLLPTFGSGVATIEADGWPIAARIDVALAGDAPVEIAVAAGGAVVGFALAARRPDLLIVLGDRIEMLAAAVGALPLLVPVVHLHGGELTEGAIDEQARHAITKLAHLHCVAAEPFARRVRQLGEESWRVHVTGAPGVDRLRAAATLSRGALSERLRLPLRHPTMLVTFHPETLGPDTMARHVDELAVALAAVEGDVVITFPGADVGYGAVIARLEALAATRLATRLERGLGEDTYCSLLREADVMIGNSSSGLIEAPTFGLPCVNIGARQRGRLRAANVIDVEHGREEIVGGIRRALDPAFRRGLAGLENPYGDGRAAPRIARLLREVELGRRLIEKRFVDRVAPPT
jgi:UDP-hydrolysing UDP-N-acetyl-D-glucosamine 2-epimerase